MKNIVWLASWFPNRVEPYLGDFIERHAQCASLYNNIHVICAVKDPGLKFRFQKETRRYSVTLTAVVYYYPRIAFLGKSFEKFSSLAYSVLLPVVGFVRYYLTRGKPACVHVFVSWKAGLAALLLRKFFKTPYALFERWTLFVPGAKPHISQFSQREQAWIGTIFKNASVVNTTTQYFAAVLQAQYGKPVAVIPNGIVPELFYYKPKPVGRPFRFLHASTLDYQKNIDGLLEAFAQLQAEGWDCELHVYGPDKAWPYGPLKNIFFGGEVPHAQIAAAMQQADAFVLFSRYETFGNVVIEAQACGLPVITTNHPVFDETVMEHVNGLRAENGSVRDLVSRMKGVMQHYDRFDRSQIAAAALATYNPARIGQLFDAFYAKFSA